MGIHHYVLFLKDPKTNEKYQKMKAIAESCDAAGVEWPDEVGKYFGHDTTFQEPLKIERKIEPTQDDYREIFVVKVKEIPPETDEIHFVVSY